MYKFLSTEIVMLIHQNLINEFGGMHGIRDQGLLESAIYAPQATFDSKYLYKNIYEISAAYAYHIIKNHPFIDGNKRTGLMAAIMFLEYNNCSINFKPNELYNLGIKIATSTITVSEIAQILKSVQ